MNHNERKNIEVLERRLAHLEGRERKNSYDKSEIRALRFAIEVLREVEAVEAAEAAA